MTISIIARLQFETLHYWPDASGPEAYLKFPHRHMMHVEAVKDVEHSDRDIEFIEFRAQLISQCEQKWGYGNGPHTQSCEMIAHTLLGMFDLRSCRVFEDNELGAEVRR